MSKRTRRKESEMFSMMAQYHASGLTQREFCNEAALPKSVFQYWWRRYRVAQEHAVPAVDGGGGFVELKSSGGHRGLRDKAAPIRLELLLGDGCVIRFMDGLPPETYVATLLQAFRPC